MMYSDILQLLMVFNDQVQQSKPKISINSKAIPK